VAAVTLGIVGPKAFARRTGRNEAFNHAGNAVAAAIAGITAYSFGPIVVFWLLAAMGQRVRHAVNSGGRHQPPRRARA
jgi:hypothetical protein